MFTLGVDMGDEANTEGQVEHEAVENSEGEPAAAGPSSKKTL